MQLYYSLTTLLAKRAYLSLLVSPPPTFLTPATIRPYDRPDAAQIIQSLAARTMGHRSSMSSALTSGSISNLPTFDSTGSLHNRALPTSVPGMNGFAMPKPQIPIRNGGAVGTPGQRVGGGGGVHHRTGSASSSWTRQPGTNGIGGGVLNFSSSSQRLPTHTESSSMDPPSRSSSTSDSADPIVVMESSTTPAWKVGAKPRGSISGGMEQKVRRESVSADKALREVQKALAGVEA